MLWCMVVLSLSYYVALISLHTNAYPNIPKHKHYNFVLDAVLASNYCRFIHGMVGIRGMGILID